MKRIGLFCGTAFVGVSIGVVATFWWHRLGRIEPTVRPAEIAQTPVDGPKVEKPLASLHVSESTWRFGEVKHGKKIRHQIRLENRGAAPLEILRIATESQHLSARLDTAHIPPGGTGLLELTLQFTNVRGPQNHSVTIESNDLENPSVEVHAVGEIHTSVQFSPEPLSLVAKWEGEELVGDVTLHLADGLTLAIHKFTTNAPWIEAEVLPDATSSEKMTIRIKASPPPKTPNRVWLVHLHTDQVGQYAVLPIRVRVTPSSKARPRTSDEG